MLPPELTAASFRRYPPLGRQLSTQSLPLLQQLPLLLVPILLRELIAFDWRFPAEREDLTRQLRYLSGLSPSQRQSVLAGFRSLSLAPELAATDWVNDPAAFMEKLTATLWSTHQMDSFRETAEAYARAVDASQTFAPPALPRLGIVLVGAGSPVPTTPLFRKLRPYGVRLSRLKPEAGLDILLAEANRRAALQPAPAQPFRHWYIDGGTVPVTQPRLTQISYAALEPARVQLLQHIDRAIQTGGMGPEELRSLLVRISPADVGLATPGSDPVLDHFQLSLLTEGAGTQIFATTFAQWAARECLRRAQPETLVVRYAPRREAATMNAMLSDAKPAALDPVGSLVDADMGAFYTWINMRRLPGFDDLRFLAWFEGHGEAVVVGPGLPQGTTSDSALDMHQVLKLLQT